MGTWVNNYTFSSDTSWSGSSTTDSFIITQPIQTVGPTPKLREKTNLERLDDRINAYRQLVAA